MAVPPIRDSDTVAKTFARTSVVRGSWYDPRPRSAQRAEQDAHWVLARIPTVGIHININYNISVIISCIYVHNIGCQIEYEYVQTRSEYGYHHGI